MAHKSKHRGKSGGKYEGSPRDMAEDAAGQRAMDAMKKPAPRRKAPPAPSYGGLAQPPGGGDPMMGEDEGGFGGM